MAAQSNWSQAAGAEVGEAVGAVVASAPHLLLAQPGCATSATSAQTAAVAARRSGGWPLPPPPVGGGSRSGARAALIAACAAVPAAYLGNGA